MINDLRFSLTEHVRRILLSYENYKLLIHPNIDSNEIIYKILDDISLMPKIPKTKDGCRIEFYRYDYDQNIYSKSELLAFIFASINKDFDVVKGIDKNNGDTHYFLKYKDIVYDPSLAVITSYKLYSERFETFKIIKNSEVLEYLKKCNNLYKYYHKETSSKVRNNFSIDLVNKIISRFNNNVKKQYELDEETLIALKDYFWLDEFIKFRQILTCSRISDLKSNRIIMHPDVDKSVLDEINKYTSSIKEMMNKEYNICVDYHNNTIGNCYALSIMFTLFHKDFKLVQGGMPYIQDSCEKYYQHSWLEYKDYVYDPSLRIVTTKELYYKFLEKHDEYSKKDVEEMLKRIGFNLTHFRDYLNGEEIGDNWNYKYRNTVKNIDSLEYKEAGERLLSLVKRYK